MNRTLRVLLDALVVALAAWQIADVAGAMAIRLGANFDLEWMEGATLLAGVRAAEGLPLYADPQPDYIPFIYPPLHAWLLGALAQLAPLGYALGRSASILCTAVAAGILAITARREGASWPTAFGVAGLFIGCYEEGGTFYDLVRTDALAIALGGAALMFGRAESRFAAVMSGLLLAVAFTAKQNLALFGLPILIWRWRTQGRADALIFLAASLGPALAFLVGMHFHTDGRFLTYLIDVPRSHGMVATRALPNWNAGRLEGAQAEVWRALPIVATVGLLTAWSWVRTRRGAYWAGVLATGLLMVSLMRGHTGGYLNVLIPMFWILPLLAVVPVRALRASTGWRAWIPHGFTLLLAGQLWLGKSNLDRYLPTDADVASAAQLIDELRTLPGPVLMPHAPYYPVLAGHDPSFSLITLWDIDHAGGPLKRQTRVIDDAMREGHWKSIVLPNDKLGHGLQRSYTARGTLRAPPFSTRTGWAVCFGSIPGRCRGTGTVWHPSATQNADAAPSTDAPSESNAAPPTEAERDGPPEHDAP